MTSYLYQGKWRHKVHIDGNPFSGLGYPLNDIRGDRVIVSGSEEEKIYEEEIKQIQEEIARKEEVFRKNLENAENILIGTWRSRSGLITFKKLGLFSIDYDDGSGSLGKWSFFGDTIRLEINRKRKHKNDTWIEAKARWSYLITYIDENNFTLVDEKDKSEIGHYKRIK